LKLTTPEAYLKSVKLKETLKVYENCKTQSERFDKMEELSVTAIFHQGQLLNYNEFLSVPLLFRD